MIMGIIMILTIFIPGRGAGIVITMGVPIGIGFTYIYSYLTFREITK